MRVRPAAIFGPVDNPPWKRQCALPSSTLTIRRTVGTETDGCQIGQDERSPPKLHGGKRKHSRSAERNGGHADAQLNQQNAPAEAYLISVAERIFRASARLFVLKGAGPLCRPSLPPVAFAPFAARSLNSPWSFPIRIGRLMAAARVANDQPRRPPFNALSAGSRT
jgi:hypothetical protein